MAKTMQRKKKKATILATLNATLRMLLIEAVQQSGTYLPDESLIYVEERMRPLEYDTAVEFLNWCHKGKHTFGHGNIDKMYKEFYSKR